MRRSLPTRGHVLHRLVVRRRNRKGTSTRVLGKDLKHPDLLALYRQLSAMRGRGLVQSEGAGRFEYRLWTLTPIVEQALIYAAEADRARNAAADSQNPTPRVPDDEFGIFPGPVKPLRQWHKKHPQP